MYDFDKKIFVVISDSELVEQFCAMFSHKPSAALKIKYLTPVSQGEDENNDWEINLVNKVVLSEEIKNLS